MYLLYTRSIHFPRDAIGVRLALDWGGSSSRRDHGYVLEHERADPVICLLSSTKSLHGDDALPEYRDVVRSLDRPILRRERVLEHVKLSDELATAFQ